METFIILLMLASTISARSTENTDDCTLTIRCEHQHSRQPCEFCALTPGQSIVITCTGSPGSIPLLFLGEQLLPLTDTTSSSVSATHILTDNDNGKEVQCVKLCNNRDSHESVRQNIRVLRTETSRRLDRRPMRSVNAISPLYVTAKKVYLQRGLTYLLPCPVLQPGDGITVVAWFKGSSCDPNQRDLILQTDTEAESSTRYQFSSAHGIIIESVWPTDSDRYWCKVLKVSSDRYVEDFVDATVLDKTFPNDCGSPLNNDSTRVHMYIDNKKTIKCPVLALKGQPRDEVTVYWSVLAEDGQSLDILLPRFSGGGDAYSQGDNNTLTVNEFSRRDEIYCCHVFQQDTDLRNGCVEVTWEASAKQKHPFISGCDVRQANRCDVELLPNQDFLQLECSVSDVYPKPKIRWSFSDCNGQIARFSTCDDLTYESAFLTYNVTSKLYIYDLQSMHGVCNFTCTALGDALAEGIISSSVVISRLEMLPTKTSSDNMIMIPADCTCNYMTVIFLMIVFMILLFLLLFWIILLFPRNRKFLKKHTDDLPKLKCLEENMTSLEVEVFPADKTPDASGDSGAVFVMSENVQNAEIELEEVGNEENAVQVKTPLISVREGQSNFNDNDKGRQCLVNRKTPDILFTDNINSWTHKGEFVIDSFGNENIDSGFQTSSYLFVNEDTDSGFQAIKDVICIQDGGLVVIDTKGLHQYTSAYCYRYVDLYSTLKDGDYCCVAYFTSNKLILGLKMGKMVIFDIGNNEISNFSSVTPVKDVDVQLADITVDCEGFVFADDINGKVISIFDKDGVCLKWFEISIEPVFLFAHTYSGAQSLFVSSRTTVKKYNVDRGGTNTNNTLAKVRFTIDKASLAMTTFHPTAIAIQGHKLLVVVKLQNETGFQILQHDAASGTEEHGFIVAPSGPKAAAGNPSSRKVQRLEGLTFMDEDRILVYTHDEVHMFARV